MLRRLITLAILAMLILPLVGGVIAEAACLEQCEDEGEDASCTPMCAACRSCAHAQPGIVRAAVSLRPGPAEERLVPAAIGQRSSLPPADIFHVPLPG